MQKVINFFDKKIGIDFSQKIDYKTEILSGLTVAIALVPESVAFAILAGIPAIHGLYAAIVVSFIASVFGGRPGMISGATGAIAIVILSLAQAYGVEYIFATVILAGIIQILAGVFKLGKFMRLVPHPVIFGFVNGLAVVIFMSQIEQFQVEVGKNADGSRIMTWLETPELLMMLGLVGLTMLIIWGLPKITKVIPSSLAAIISIFALVTIFGIDTKTVLDVSPIGGSFPPFHIPNVPFTFETLQIIFPYAFIVAGVGLIESLLTLNIIDEITGTHGKSNKEAMAQGAANISSGFFSGMGGCAMIGQSLINIGNGARTRISGIVASVTLLMIVMFGSGLIEKVPMAALTGLMIMVAIGTFEWASLRIFNKFPKSDVFVMVLVTLVTIFLHNLALAVLVGVIISALVFAWESARTIRAKSYLDAKGVKHYEIEGPLFFGSTQAFSQKFDIENDAKEVIIDFKNSRVADMSAIEVLNKLTKKYKDAGKIIHLRHLSQDCRMLIENADELVDVNIKEDPSYKVMLDK